MDEKTKLYVFEKKEIALIFLFMILIGITSFILGVRVGKNYSYQVANVSSEERQAIEILSNKEEQVKATTEANEVKKTEDLLSREEIERELERKLREEMERQLAPVVDNNVSDYRGVETTGSVPDPAVARKGKFTIQLGAYRTLDEANRFANGFTVRGYSPVIYAAEIAGRGTWYRVSLGEFLTREEAREYIVQESSLFQGQTPLINVFE